MKTEVAIIGAGPAGVSAAVHLKHADVDIVLLERDRVGGLLWNANVVENFPGFPGGITGRRLAGLFEEQLRAAKIKLEKARVLRVSRKGKGFRVETDKKTIESRCTIMATGTVPRGIGLRGARGLMGTRIFHDLKDVPRPRKGKRFVVIGGGDAAFDYALNLASDGCDVRIVMKGSKERCIPVLAKRAKREPRISVVRDALPVSVRQSAGAHALACNKKGRTLAIPFDCLLIACGRAPNLDLLGRELSKSIRIDGRVETSVPGLFIVGDVSRGDYRQAGIAAGDGILAAMMAVSLLRSEGSR